MHIAPNISIANQKLLDEKIKTIQDQGRDALHVISDFDRTLTKCFYNGDKISPSVSFIRSGGYLGEEYTQKAYQLFDTYHPIETDYTLSDTYRYEKMQEWWQKHEQLFVASGMHQGVIDEIVTKHPKVFREHSDQLLHILAKYHIPLLIFSAGIGNIIEGYLSHAKRLTSNVHILSNTFAFDEEGRATGYKGEIIHTMNKSMIHMTDSKYQHMIADRKNVLLLGDSLNDADMANSIHTSTTIKVGFLNEHKEKKLEQYMSVYDIVITDDGSLEYVVALLKKCTET